MRKLKNALLGGEVRKAKQTQKYFNHLLFKNQTHIWIVAALGGYQGRLPPLSKAYFPASMAAFARTCSDQVA